MSERKRRVLIPRQPEIDTRLIYFTTAERWGEEQAVTYRARILNAFNLLADNPEAGFRAKGSLSGFRMFPIERHGIWYRLTDEELIVTRVIHGRRNVTEKFLTEAKE